MPPWGVKIVLARRPTASFPPGPVRAAGTSITSPSGTGINIDSSNAVFDYAGTLNFATAGQAVVFAGGTVVLAMAALVLTGVGFLTSIGLATSIGDVKAQIEAHSGLARLGVRRGDASGVEDRELGGGAHLARPVEIGP